MKKLLICLCLLLSGCLSSGIKKDEVVTYERERTQIDASWKAVETTKENLIVVLFYDENLSSHAYAVYEKGKGDLFNLSVSGTLPLETEEVIDYIWKDYHIYMSLNQNHIQSYELYNNCDVTKGSLDGNKPFVLIFPNNAGEITFYTSDGRAIHGSSSI